MHAQFYYHHQVVNVLIRFSRRYAIFFFTVVSSQYFINFPSSNSVLMPPVGMCSQNSTRLRALVAQVFQLFLLTLQQDMILELLDSPAHSSVHLMVYYSLATSLYNAFFML